MSATTTAAPETAAGGSTTSTDPIDSLDFSDVVQTADSHTSAIPDYMLLGGERPAESAEEGEEAEPVATDATGERPALPEGYKYDSVGRVRDAKTGHMVAKDKVAEIMQAAEAAAQPQGEPQPFRYRVNGETKDAEGYTENADGSVTVSKDKAGDLRAMFNAREMLGEGSALVDRVKGENAQLRQQLEQVKQGGTAAEARANALIKTYTDILADPNEENAIQSFFELRARYPELLAQAEANHWKTVATSGRPGAQPERSTQTAERENAAPSALPPRESAIAATNDHIERLKLEHQFREIPPDDWKQFSDAVARKPYAYLRPATAEDAKEYGVSEGEIVFDTDALADDITSHATRSKAARETAAAQAKLAADNARRTAPTIEAPPVAGGGITPAKTPKKITTKQEMDDWWESTDL